MRMRSLALAALLLGLIAGGAQARCYQDQTGGGQRCEGASPATVNGTGIVTRPANTTAYTGNQLIANNTSGSATPAQVVVTDNTNAGGGTGLIIAASALTSNTGATAPGNQVWHLFSATPTVNGLIDGSAYIAPYAADGAVYLGSLTCSAWAKTNDATAQWRSSCYSSGLITGPLPFKAASGQTYLYALLETTGAYTPISGEVETLVVSTAQNN